jgi:hypothetical protein
MQNCSGDATAYTADPAVWDIVVLLTRLVVLAEPFRIVLFAPALIMLGMLLTLVVLLLL